MTAAQRRTSAPSSVEGNSRPKARNGRASGHAQARQVEPTSDRIPGPLPGHRPDLLLFSREFFEPSAAWVAPRLLGHWLLFCTPTGWSGGIIVETEAYLAHDPACHGYKRQTARNRTMYGPPGHAYVYFIYGNHWCFNAVCGPPGVAEAVLVRAIEPAVGLPWMQKRRAVADARELTNGPAKCCAALGIDRTHDGIDLCQAASPVLLARHPQHDHLMSCLGPLITTTRIGISQAPDWPLRFYLEGSRFVSKRAQDAGRAPARSGARPTKPEAQG
ncbi:MAG TPA: DNA-3-methyladenine glycosylase [Verrucomicrobiae bacterium]|nr:DNA-3-methyladenine glycosylase [Verrucomicrobiae bacterium]